jgi:hypothetical protein
MIIVETEIQKRCPADGERGQWEKALSIDNTSQ